MQWAHQPALKAKLNNVQGGTPQNPELSPGGQAPCSTGFPCYMNLLQTHLYHCTSWHCCERLHSTLVNFFWKTLSRPLLISRWVIYKRTCLHCTECSPVFHPKQHDPGSPHALFLPPVLPEAARSGQDFFCFLDEKSPQRKMFCSCGEVKQKTAKALKDIKINKFKNCFEQWEKYCIKWRVL